MGAKTTLTIRKGTKTWRIRVPAAKVEGFWRDLASDPECRVRKIRKTGPAPRQSRTDTRPRAPHQSPRRGGVKSGQDPGGDDGGDGPGDSDPVAVRVRELLGRAPKLSSADAARIGAIFRGAGSPR